MDKERSTLLGEIRAYEDALHHAEAGSVSRGWTVVHGASGGSGGDAGSGIAKSGAGGSGRSVSEHWGILLVALHKLDKAFTTEDVLKAAKEAGVPTSAVNARSQIAIYRKKKILERVRIGKYRVRRPALVQLGLLDAEEKGPNEKPGPLIPISEARNH